MRRVVAMTLVAAAASACSVGANSKPGSDVSTFRLQTGDCANPPTQVHAELSTLRVVPCTSPHTEEAYAIVKYSAATADVGRSAPYPGETVLKRFADGACAQRYEGYVGVAYPDSSLFFTYLLPSARSWQANDRSTVCFVTTTGATLTHSVKNTKV